MTNPTIKRICNGCKHVLFQSESKYCAKCRMKIATRIDEYKLTKPEKWVRYYVKIKGATETIMIYAEMFSTEYNHFDKKIHLSFGIRLYSPLGTPYERKYGPFYVLVADLDVANIESLQVEKNNQVESIDVSDKEKNLRRYKRMQAINRFLAVNRQKRRVLV